jgi:hypothetical protein
VALLGVPALRRTALELLNEPQQMRVDDLLGGQDFLERCKGPKQRLEHRQLPTSASKCGRHFWVRGLGRGLRRIDTGDDRGDSKL